jgi:4-diphosphocytidyl-2-C-methyl-D-erythritol kinase
MVVFPISKINIGLRITGKRPDGYHNIETIFYPVRFSDALEFVAADNNAKSDELVVTGIDTGVPPEENIIIKAISKLRIRKDFPYLKIHLHKAIPAGAGLGGGSSDAACLLKSVNRHFQLGLDINILKSLSLEIGSDCPFFIDSLPSLASGRGEQLSHVEKVLSGFHMVLLNPGVGIATAEAYANCKPQEPPEKLNELFKLPVNEWKNRIVNDFENFAFIKHPVIKEIKEGLYKTGALFSLMSGSGSSVYGIFGNNPNLPADLRKYIIYQGIF